MRIMSTKALFSLALIAATAVPGASFARPGIVPGSDTRAGDAPIRVSSATHKLNATTIDTGYSGVTVQPYALPVIDSAVVNCPRATCTIVVDVTAEIGGQSTAGNQWAACGVVDGQMAANGCPYNGTLPSDGSYLTGSARQTFSVTHGSHNAGFEAFVSSASATAAIYDVHYDVLVP